MKRSLHIPLALLAILFVSAPARAGVRAEKYVREDDATVPVGNCMVQQYKVYTQPVNISQTSNGHRERRVGGVVSYYGEWGACTDPASITGNFTDVLQLIRLKKTKKPQHWLVLKSELPLLRREGLRKVGAFPVPHAKGTLYLVRPIP